MKIDVSDLINKTGNEAKIRESENLKFPEEELKLSGPVDVDVKLVSTGSSILVTGKVRARISQVCVRCLKEFESDVVIDLEEEYSKARKRNRDREEVELKDDDFVFLIGDDDTIDLTEAIRQNLLVSLPIKPLCGRECAGIKTKPAKKSKAVDPRLAKLKDMFN